MGGKSKPRASDYRPSQTEAMQASIAKSDFEYITQAYDPLLREEMERVTSEDLGGRFEGIASANVAESIGRPDYRSVSQDIDLAADYATAAHGAGLHAGVTALGQQRGEQANVLSMAKGTGAEAAGGLAAASRLASSEALNTMRGKEAVRRAKRQAKFSVGTAFANQMGQNLRDTPAGVKRNPFIATGQSSIPQFDPTTGRYLGYGQKRIGAFGKEKAFAYSYEAPQKQLPQSTNNLWGFEDD